TEEQFDRVCNVDFKGAYFCSQKAANFMIEHDIAGNIIMISSNNSIAHFAEVSVYATMKAAMNKMAEHMAIELAKYKIRVNTIAPGWTDTGASRLDAKAETYYKVPLQKWVEPSEIADTALFLASDSAKSITGATIVMDNGATLVSDRRERYGF
ncbi:MAG: SDR family oxidoreductase, partial [Clostridia bacterium]|nr:SDR family oxidoreductase [Clostridia bacterium]